MTPKCVRLRCPQFGLVKDFEVYGSVTEDIMRALMLTVGLGAAAVLATIAKATPDLPVPRHDTLQDYQNSCSEANGFKTFSMQVSCVKALVNESTNRFLNTSDPDTQLYLLTADKLVDDVRSKRSTVASARISLQRALIEVQSKHQAEFQAIQARADADARQRVTANERAQEAAERSHQIEAQETEQRQMAQLAAQAQQAQQEQAVRLCMDKVNQRFSDLATHGNGTQRATANIQWGTMNIAQVCARDPNYYASMPAVPTVTHCQGQNDHYNVEVTCTNN